MLVKQLTALQRRYEGDLKAAKKAKKTGTRKPNNKKSGLETPVLLSDQMCDFLELQRGI